MPSDMGAPTSGARVVADLQKSISALEEHIGEITRVRILMQELPRKVRHKVMVPFGEAAFFPGHLVHTNECLVNLGKEHVVECSTHHASSILERRKGRVQAEAASATEELQKLEQQLSKAPGGLNATFDKTEPGTLLDIREEYDAAVMGPCEEPRRTIERPFTCLSAASRGTADFEPDVADLFTRLENAEAAAEREQSTTRARQKAPNAKALARGFYNRAPKSSPASVEATQPVVPGPPTSFRPEVLRSVVERRPAEAGFPKPMSPGQAFVSGNPQIADVGTGAAELTGMNSAPQASKRVSRFKQQRLAKQQ